MLDSARSVLALIVTAALLALAAVTPAAAQKQTVVIYTAIENEQIAEYKKAYEKSLPNIDVKMLRLSTGDIAARFMAEKDNMQADVIWGVGATNHARVQERGPARAVRAQGAGADPAALPRQGEPALLGRASTSTCPPSASTPRWRKKHNLPAPDVLGGPHQARLQGPRGDAEPGLLRAPAISRWPPSCSGWARPKGWKYLDAIHPNMAEYTKSGSKPCKDAAAGRARPSACRSSTSRSR